jgi:hypothetical protein
MADWKHGTPFVFACGSKIPENGCLRGKLGEKSRGWTRAGGYNSGKKR